MTNADKYFFWDGVRYIAENLDDITEHRGDKWLETFCFKENLKYDIQIIDNLLENTTKLKINALGVDLK